MKTSWEIEFDKKFRHKEINWEGTPAESSYETWNAENLDDLRVDEVKDFIKSTIDQSIQADRKRLAEEVGQLIKANEPYLGYDDTTGENNAYDEVLEIINSNFLKE